MRSTTLRLALVFVLLCGVRETFAQSGLADRWVGTWTTAEVGRPQTPVPPTAPPLAPFMVNARCPAPATPPVAPPPGQVFAPPPYVHFTNQTLRQIVRTSIGGSKVRVVLSNAYGTAPVTIGGAHMALRDKQGAIQAASGGPLTFSGKPTMTIPANAVIYSDPVALTVPPMSDLAIDLYLPGTTNAPATLTMHGAALQTSYISETGNYAGKTTMPEVGTTRSWFLLSRVDVVAPDATGAIVAFGDSITDGAQSTADTNNRWPDHLARRLQSQGIKMGVLNAGIGGNRVLNEAAVPPGVDTRAVGAGRDTRHRAGRHQRHRQRTAEPDAVSAGSHRRAQTAHRAGARARSQGDRRDIDAVLGRRVLHRSRRSKAPGAQRVDSDGQGLRRRHRFRQGDPRPRRSEEASREIRFVRLPAPE
jgi:GDSL-like Lipase/Acylhydrolase family